MEMILINAKLADWMTNFYIDVPKPTPKKIFQWMENGSSRIIPFWIFPDIVDKVLDPEDEQYFDEYDIGHHSEASYSPKSSILQKIEDNNFFRSICYICFIILLAPCFIPINIYPLNSLFSHSKQFAI